MTSGEATECHECQVPDGREASLTRGCCDRQTQESQLATRDSTPSRHPFTTHPSHPPHPPHPPRNIRTPLQLPTQLLLRRALPLALIRPPRQVLLLHLPLLRRALPQIRDRLRSTSLELRLQRRHLALQAARLLVGRLAHHGGGGVRSGRGGVGAATGGFVVLVGVVEEDGDGGRGLWVFAL